MSPPAPLRDRSLNTYSDGGRAADWSNAFVVALVLSVAVLLAALAIAVYDNAALLAYRRGVATFEQLTPAPARGVPEMSGTAQ